MSVSEMVGIRESSLKESAPQLGAVTYDEVLELLFREAELLDEHRYSEWLELLSHDIEYRMPVQRTRTAANGGNEFSDRIFLFDENFKSLQWRVELLEKAGSYNWVEDPRSLTRHIIGNVRLSATDPSGCSVRSNFIVYRGIGGKLEHDLFTGRRLDALTRRENGDLCLQSRMIHLDQTLVLARNLSILF